MTRRLLPAVAAAAIAALAVTAPSLPQASAAGTVSESFPEDFPEIIDASLGKPVIGFGGSEGPVTRTPVILLHGNNDTPYPILATAGSAT